VPRRSPTRPPAGAKCFDRPPTTTPRRRHSWRGHLAPNTYEAPPGLYPLESRIPNHPVSNIRGESPTIGSFRAHCSSVRQVMRRPNTGRQFHGLLRSGLLRVEVDTNPLNRAVVVVVQGKFND
jgi:hypothetical protein